MMSLYYCPIDNEPPSGLFAGKLMKAAGVVYLFSREIFSPENDL